MVGVGLGQAVGADIDRVVPREVRQLGPTARILASHRNAQEASSGAQDVHRRLPQGAGRAVAYRGQPSSQGRVGSGQRLVCSDPSVPDAQLEDEDDDVRVKHKQVQSLHRLPTPNP